MISFSFSAHAKDIWTTPDWEKREKIAGTAWGVTCTEAGLSELRRLSPPDDPEKVRLVYHGLDLSRFPDPPPRSARRTGGDATDPVMILSVGRMVAKKGYGDLLLTATLASLAVLVVSAAIAAWRLIAWLRAR